MEDEETARNVMKRAFRAYQQDARFHRIVDMVVATTMNEHGRIDPDRADREAHDIAKRVAAILLQYVYEEDRELSAMKVERDQFQKIAEQALVASPTYIALKAITDQ